MTIFQRNQNDSLLIKKCGCYFICHFRFIGIDVVVAVLLVIIQADHFLSHGNNFQTTRTVSPIKRDLKSATATSVKQ